MESHELNLILMLPNFNLTSGGKLSDRLINKEITTFHKAVKYIHKLPYGRNTRPANYWTIIHEGRGTCTSKHAYLKALAEENDIYSIHLMMSIYMMNEGNTPGVGVILDSYNLEYIIEAHTCLCYDGDRYDYTFPNTINKPWEASLLSEESIDPDQIGEYKVNYHKSILKDWIKRDQIPFSLDEIWRIREECIAALGN